MVKTRLYKNNLCETYSTLGKNLLQVETSIIYSSSVIDRLEGYNENREPYSRFTYIEDNSNNDEVTQEEIAQAIESIL